MDNVTKTLLIRDAINGAARSLARPAAFFHVFIDYVHLLFQRPCCVTFWEPGRTGKERIFWSFRDRAAVPEDSWSALEEGTPVIVPQMRGYSATVHEVGPAGFSYSRKWTRLLHGLWTPGKADKIPVEFCKQLESALGLVRDGGICWPDPDTTDAADISSSEILSDSRRRITRAVDRVFARLRDSNLLQISSGVAGPDGQEAHCLNLFAAMRWVPRPSPWRYEETFAYTASLLLTPEQTSETLHWLNALAQSGDSEARRLLGGDWESIIQTPLGSHSRAVFDSTTSSGFADFGLEGTIGEAGVSGTDARPWRDIAGDDDDKVRQRIEEQIYRRLVSGNESAGAHVIFYVPVHVYGVPWLSLFTFADSSPTGWLQHYQLYRDVLSRSNDLLRREIEGEFISLVTGQLQGHFELPRPELVTAVNDKYRHLAQIFPYPRLQFTIVPPETQELQEFAQVELPSGDLIWLSTVPNNYQPPHLQHDTLDEARLIHRLRGAAGQRTFTERAANNILHSVKNYIGEGLRFVEERVSMEEQPEIRGLYPLQAASRLATAVYQYITRRKLEKHRVPGDTFQQRIVQFCQTMLPEGTLTFTLSGELPAILTEPDFAEAITYEIVTNAVRHGPPGSEVTVAFFRSEAQSPPLVGIRVTNRFREERLATLEALRSRAALPRHKRMALDEIEFLQEALGVPCFEVSRLDVESREVEFTAHFGFVEE